MNSYDEGNALFYGASFSTFLVLGYQAVKESLASTFSYSAKPFQASISSEPVVKPTVNKNEEERKLLEHEQYSDA